MEDAHFEAPILVESEFFFPPHRRSHLRSETYRTLVRILSPFCDNTNVSLATEFDPRELRAGILRMSISILFSKFSNTRN